MIVQPTGSPPGDTMDALAISLSAYLSSSGEGMLSCGGGGAAGLPVQAPSLHALIVYCRYIISRQAFLTLLNSIINKIIILTRL